MVLSSRGAGGTGRETCLSCLCWGPRWPQARRECPWGRLLSGRGCRAHSLREAGPVWHWRPTLWLLCAGKQLLQKQVPVHGLVALLHLGGQRRSGERAGTGPVALPASRHPPQEPQPHGTHFAVTTGLPAELSSPRPTLTPTWTEGPAGSRPACALSVAQLYLLIFK